MPLRRRRWGSTASIFAPRSSSGASSSLSACCRRRTDCRAMIDFCLVGAGFIGPVHAANLALHPGARRRWVIDLNPDAAKTLADRYGARAGGDLGEALADRAIGAAILCTPPRPHAPN